MTQVIGVGFLICGLFVDKYQLPRFLSDIIKYTTGAYKICCFDMNKSVVMNKERMG